MRDVLFGLGALACPIGMGAMMWGMGRGIRKPTRDASTVSPSIETLREEHRRLGEQIDSMDHGDSQLSETMSA